MAKKLSKAQIEVLSRLANHCDLVRWKWGKVWRAYGMNSHGFKPKFRTMVKLEEAGLIAVKEYHEHVGSSAFNDYVATLTDAGRRALEDNRG